MQVGNPVQPDPDPKPSMLEVEVLSQAVSIQLDELVSTVETEIDLSNKGLTQSAGIMVNYLYDLDSIEVNHDAYFDQGEIVVSKPVARLLQ